MFSSETPINAIAFTLGGKLLFATDEGVFRVRPNDEAVRLYDTGANKLLAAADALYILDNEGTFLKIEGLSAYIDNIEIVK